MNVGRWMELAQDIVHLQDFVLTELNLRIVLPESSCPSPSGKLLEASGKFIESSEAGRRGANELRQLIPLPGSTPP